MEKNIQNNIVLLKELWYNILTLLYKILSSELDM